MDERRNVQLRYRFGSPTPYLVAALRGPKLTILSIDGSNVQASKQLEAFMPIPSLTLHTTVHPWGKGGRSGAGLGPGPAEALSVERNVSFHDEYGSFDERAESGMLRTFSGNAMVPSHCPDTVLEELDRREASVAAWSPFGKAKFGVELDSAGSIG